MCSAQRTQIEDISILDFFKWIFSNKPEQNASIKANDSSAN